MKFIRPLSVSEIRHYAHHCPHEIDKKVHIIMGTCFHPIGKNVSIDTLNVNMKNYQYPREGGRHPKNDDNHNPRHSHLRHPSGDRGGYSGWGGLIGGGSQWITARTSLSLSFSSATVSSVFGLLGSADKGT